MIYVTDTLKSVSHDSRRCLINVLSKEVTPTHLALCLFRFMNFYQYFRKEKQQLQDGIKTYRQCI